MKASWVAVLCIALLEAVASEDGPCYDPDGTPIPCHPPYENIVAGLTPAATSTCTRDDRPVCDDCSHCDAGNAARAHLPNATTDGNSDTYWQSSAVEAGGKVNLTYYLDGVFEITQVAIEFIGSVPNATAVFKSDDAGKTFAELGTYAASCGAQGSCGPFAAQRLPNSRVLVTLNLGLFVPSAPTTATLQLSFQPANDYVGVASLNVTGRCACNGHASSCLRGEGRKVACLCRHGSGGLQCDRCARGFSKKPWPAGGNVGSFACEGCPSCYQEVEKYFNTTSALFGRFVERMNASLSSVDTLNRLSELQLLIQSMLSRAQFSQQQLSLLFSAVNSLMPNVSLYSEAIREIGNRFPNIGDLSKRVKEQMMSTDAVANITNTLDVLQTFAASQFQRATELLNTSELLLQQLVSAAQESQPLSQSQLIKALALLSKAQGAVETAAAAFELSHRSIFLMNITIANFTAFEQNELETLKQLYMRAMTLLENIKVNASIAKQDHSVITQQIDKLIIPDFESDIEYLQSRLVQFSTESERLSRVAKNLTMQLALDKSQYRELQSKAQLLVNDSMAQRMKAETLLRKADLAFRTANMSVHAAEGIVGEALGLLGQLNETLPRVRDFKLRLDSLVGSLHVAENSSVMTLNEAHQANQTIMEAARILALALQQTNETITLLLKISEMVAIAGQTASTTYNSSVALASDARMLQNLSKVVQPLLETLERKAMDDSVAIREASHSVNLSLAKASELTERVAKANKTLSELKAELSSVQRVPPSRIVAINATLNQLEFEAQQNQMLINQTERLIAKLLDSSQMLEAKYTSLKQQRDLLQHILDNLNNLDCRKQYSDL